MNATALALLAALSLTAIAVAAAAFVLGREAVRRLRTRQAMRRLESARLLVGAEGAALTDIVLRLRGRFDALTIERVIDQLLDDDARKGLASSLFRELGLVKRYATRLRQARAWAERTRAAQVLGRAGCVEAIPPLVLALRDAHEDASVKTAAAEALAKLRDERAVPFLACELQAVDESASRPIAEALVRFGELAVPELLRLLADEAQPSGRVWAARVLGQVKAAAAVEQLVSLLHARNDLLRIAAAGALGEVGDRRALQPLVQATLRDPAPQVRAQAAGAVAQIEAEGALDVLVAALADPDYVTRLRALEAFENIRVEDPSPLVAALRDPKNEVRRRAALALERVGYLNRVVEELSAHDPQVARDAYFKLLELGRAGLADAVVSFVNHPEFQVRAQAARAAGELGVTNAGRVLLAALDDKEWPVRAAVAETLGRLRIDGAPERLLALLVDGEEPVREAAADALEAFPAALLGANVAEITEAYTRGTVPIRLRMVTLASRLDLELAAELLARASADPSETVRLQAVRAIGKKESAERFVPQLVERITDSSIEVRAAAVAALGSAASSEAFEALLRSLPGAPPALRERVAEALARGARAHLLQRLDELEHVVDTDVRLGIAWTLGRIGGVAVVPHLARLLRDPEATIRASAAGALAKVDSPETIEPLLAACEDRDARTRAAVVNALGKRAVADARAATRVRARLVDPDPFVRDRAALVLAAISGSEAEATLSDPKTAPLISHSARLVGLALAGKPAALELALDLMTAPDALHGALAFLAHEDPALRTAFLARLRLPDPNAVPRGLEDPALVPQYDMVLRSSLDVESRRIAVETLSRVPGALAVEVLADALRSDPTEEIRLRTARALAARTGDDRARAALVDAVRDPAEEVALVAVRALGKSREARARAALFQRLGSNSKPLAEAVEEALAEMHRTDVDPLLDLVMGLHRPEALVAGIRVLGRIADPMTTPLLELLLKSQHEDVRVSALEVLARLPRDPRIDAAVDATLDDPGERVRRVAIQTIAAPADADAVMRLERARVDPSPALRIELAQRLATTPAGQTMPLLVALADDGVPAVRASALATLLLRAESQGMRLFLDRWRRGQAELREEPRAVAITNRLALVLGASADEESRKAAIAGIASLKAPGFEKLVMPALRDPSPDVRVDAVRALAGNNDPEVRTRIAELLEDPVATVREAARRSHLRMIG